jgi:hypothetical protein
MTLEKLNSMTAEWRCPDCGIIYDHSYLDLVEVGNPICHFCDIEMELVTDEN